MPFLRLQHIRTDGETDTYHLKPGRDYIVGRGSDADIRILDLKLSRKHAMFRHHDGAWQVLDCEGHNGSRIDHVELAEATTVKEGQVWTGGNSSLTILGEFEHLPPSGSTSSQYHTQQDPSANEGNEPRQGR